MKLTDEHIRNISYDVAYNGYTPVAYESLAMARELLAARKVIEEAKILLQGHQNCGTTDCCLISQEIEFALAVYDKI